MKEQEPTLQPRELSRDDFILKINELLQTTQTIRGQGQSMVEQADCAITSINNLLEFVNFSEEQGLKVKYFQDEITGGVFVKVGKKARMGFVQ